MAFFGRGTDSTQAYGFIDECFAYLKNLAIAASVVGVLNQVNLHPGQIFSIKAQSAATTGFAYIAVFLSLGAGMSFTHRVRALAAQRLSQRWNSYWNGAFMIVGFWATTVLGLMFVIAVANVINAAVSH